MMNFIFRIIPLFLILGFVSCNKDLSYETINNRIIGEWSVGEVNFNPKGYGGKKNVTGNFKDLKFDFRNDGSLLLTESETKHYEGYWYIDEVSEWDSKKEENIITTKIVGSVYNLDNNLYRDFYWKEISISSSKLKFKETKNGGTYFYKLIK
jgi:hypothetical protein